MKKQLILVAALLALGSVASAVYPSLAQDTTNSQGETVGTGQNGSSQAEGTGGNGTGNCDISASSSSIEGTDCPSSSAAM